MFEENLKLNIATFAKRNTVSPIVKITFAFGERKQQVRCAALLGSSRRAVLPLAAAC